VIPLARVLVLLILTVSLFSLLGVHHPSPWVDGRDLSQFGNQGGHSLSAQLDPFNRASDRLDRSERRGLDFECLLSGVSPLAGHQISPDSGWQPQMDRIVPDCIYSRPCQQLRRSDSYISIVIHQPKFGE
jgi:hypothetical protein